MPRGPIPRSVQKDIAFRRVYDQQIAESVKRQREEARAEKETPAAEESAETTTAAPAARKGRQA